MCVGVHVGAGEAMGKGCHAINPSRRSAHGCTSVSLHAVGYTVHVRGNDKEGSHLSPLGEGSLLWTAAFCTVRAYSCILSLIDAELCSGAIGLAL